LVVRFRIQYVLTLHPQDSKEIWITVEVLLIKKIERFISRSKFIYFVEFLNRFISSTKENKIMHKFIYISFLLLFSSMNCSSVSSLQRDPDFEKKIVLSKRIMVVANTENKITKMEQLTLTDLARDLIGHHKEFIVYKTPPKFPGTCSKEVPKVEAIFMISLSQEKKANDLNLLITGNLIQCRDQKSIWSASVSKAFPLDSNENESLKNTYIQRYGMGIGSLVNPYYKILSILIDALDSPVLTNEEKDEKIEVESI
jgi:probable lipoprotein (TIGR04455 family)